MDALTLGVASGARHLRHRRPHLHAPLLLLFCKLLPMSDAAGSLQQFSDQFICAEEVYVHLPRF